MNEEQDGAGNRRLWWLLSSTGVGNLADGIAKVAFPLLATTLTHDPVLIAGLSATQFLPWLLFGLIAGTLVDRVDRRRAMIFANIGRAAVIGALTILIAVGGMSIWLVYAAALLIGTAETVAESAANALIPSVVDERSLESANSKLQACEIVGQTFLGGPVGSATFALFALFPFLLTSAGFAVAAALLLGLAGSFRPKPTATGTPGASPTRLHTELLEGLRWLKGHPLLLRMVAIAGLLSLVSELAQAQLVLYALDDLHLNEATYGLFAFIGGIGGLLGAATAPRMVQAAGRRAVLVIGIACCALGFGGMGLIRQPVAGALLFGLFAAAIVIVNVVFATARHTLVPGALLGRVLGVWRTVVWGTIPLGALLGGVLTEALGSASKTFVVSGAGLLGVAVLAFLALRRFSLDDESASAGRAVHSDQ
ncbi:MFS transporter [Amycolatopsis sp. NPDC059027]|uniref:MFS transporter n=1 Tax=unclassified Amycolatopsis TaxID=2618356 RepID=UPI00366DF9B4